MSDLIFTQSNQPKFESIIEAFDSAYMKDDHIYRSFANALDGKNEIKRYIDSILDTKTQCVADIGAGPGIVNQRVWDSSQNMILVEPSKKFQSILRKTFSDRKECSVLASSSHLEAGTAEICFASWPDLDVREFVSEGIRIVGHDGILIIVLNFGGNDFEKLWPGGVRKHWLARIDFLLQSGFQARVVESQFEFGSCAEAKATMGYLFGEDNAKNVSHCIGHNIAVLHRGV